MGAEVAARTVPVQQKDSVMHIGTNSHFTSKLSEVPPTAERELSELWRRLREYRKELEGNVDVEDGEPGDAARPNWAMRALCLLDRHVSGGVDAC